MMKNWLLAEFGSIARAMPTVPFSNGWSENSAGRSGMSEPPVPARPSAKAALGPELDVAGLRHEAVDHPVEHHAVIGPGPRQRLDPLHVLRRDLRQQLDLDRALGSRPSTSITSTFAASCASASAASPAAAQSARNARPDHASAATRTEIIRSGAPAARRG